MCVCACQKSDDGLTAIQIPFCISQAVCDAARAFQCVHRRFYTAPADRVTITEAATSVLVSTSIGLDGWSFKEIDGLELKELGELGDILASMQRKVAPPW